MEPTVTAAGPDDEELVLELMREFYEVEHLLYRPEVARAALRELWREPVLGRVYLARLGKPVVGYLVLTFGFSLEFHGRDALVDELYVREAFRGAGIGNALLQWVEQVCDAEGIHAVHLEVDRINADAKRLYHRAGYQDHDRHLLTKWLSP